MVGGTAIRSTGTAGVLLDASRVTQSTTSGDVEAELLTIDSDTLHAGLSTLLDAPVHGRVRFEPHVAMNSVVAAMARALCGAVRSGLSADSPIAPTSETIVRLRDALVNLLLELLPHSHTDALRRPAAMPAPRHVRRAIEFVHQHAAQPLTVADIAAAANTSVRSLQAGFLRFKSVSPGAYLRQVRLAGARADLLAAGASTTVAHVARVWGFANPGAFAALYREAFGELPSATLKFGSQGRS
jgi:AraC-like DNA-binding protein